MIVKLSANSDYGTSQDESSYREMETLELFRAIVDSLREAEVSSQDSETGENAEPVSQ